MVISAGPRAGGHCNGGRVMAEIKVESLNNCGVAGAQRLPTVMVLLFLLENSMDRGYNLWSCKESDTTKQLNNNWWSRG